uniref:Enoyl reductase (ER) domain-containing protein n=1 Tax=Araucaria cunninghamii TaxID=56994 RepID=A0A0D6QR09_ARACU
MRGTVRRASELSIKSLNSIVKNVDSIRLMSTCRAVVLPRFGGPEVLEVRHTMGIPDLGASEVLIRSVAVGINPLDCRMRSGYGRSLFEPLLPLILGRDISGEVAAVGSSVRQLHVGQEVFGALHPTAVRGTYSDYAILLEEELAPKPPSLTHVEASAIPFAALTAWRALKTTARIHQGQRLLVIGGGGAVGLAAIQLSVAAGCTVVTTCGKQSIERVMAAGAEQAVDYTSEDLRAELKGQFHAVLDTIGVPDTETLGIGLLKRGGHYMTLQGEVVSLADKYGLVGGAVAASAALLKKQVQYRQSHGVNYWWVVMRTDSEGLEEIARLARAGKLKIPVAKTFPLVEAAEAHRVRDSKLVRGKVVLEIE